MDLIKVGEKLWRCTWLLADSLLHEEDRMRLTKQTILAYEKRKPRMNVKGDNYEGMISTEGKWESIGCFSGRRYDLELEVEGRSEKSRLRVLINEIGSDYCTN